MFFRRKPAPVSWIIVFLGNPGSRYENTRHNAGFMTADGIEKNAGLRINRLKFNALTNTAEIGGHRVFLMKPQTFMNLSGQSVSAVASFFKIKIDSILVVHDELELSLGTLSLKFGGGLGGHNGLRSMKASFGSADFWRLRIGIGRPDSRLPGEGGPEGSGEGIVDWVLSDFSTREAEELNSVLDFASELLMDALAGSPESLLPEWAKKKVLIDA